MSAPALSRRRLLAALLAAPTLAHAGRAANAPPLPLALDAPPGLDPAGWLVSEKLDGVRAFWDGMQLRFRSGGLIAAPAWFLARLPRTPLDGELWLGRGRFEGSSGAVRRAEPDEAEWRALRYGVFELPGAAGTFAERAQRLQLLAREADFPALWVLPQERVASAAALQRRLHEVVAGGGEGLVLHRADAPWLTGRTPALLKLKPLADAEAVVVGHLPGRGKHAGRLGALQVCDEQGRRFALGTGFSDALRVTPPALGSTVTYTYRGRTEAGLPRFASFLRVRGEP